MQWNQFVLAQDVMGTGNSGESVADSAIDIAQQDAVSAWNEVMSGDFDSVFPLIEKYLIPAGAALLILIIGYFIAKIISRIVAAPVRKRVDETLGRFIAKLVFYAVMLLVAITVMAQVGIEVTSLAAIMAAAGFAIGLAFQGTLSNFASGILLLVFRPFKVGDVVSAAGLTAKVCEIDLFTTTFDTPDNRRIIVPNTGIASGTIENVSFHEHRRVDVAVGVDYGADIDATRAVLEQAAESLSDVMIKGDGRGYQIVLGDLGDSAVNWTVRLWCNTRDYWPTKEALTRAVKVFLDDAAIGIPFPQMDIHLDRTDGADTE